MFFLKDRGSLRLLLGFAIIIVAGIFSGFSFNTLGLTIISFICLSLIFLFFVYEINEIVDSTKPLLYCLIAILTIWTTWYFVNEKTFVQDFFAHFLLR